MYDKSDPRAALIAGAKGVRTYAQYTPADYARFYETDPQEVTSTSKTWLSRGQNAVLAYSEAKKGARFVRREQADEWVLLLPDAETSATLVHNGKSHAIAGYTVTFVPPGDSLVTLHSDGQVVRLFTTRSADLVAMCANAENYGSTHPNIPELQNWPLPPDGYKVRSYSLDVPDVPGRFGRIWRCTTFMINFLPPNMGPREITKMSPHHHEDFEQYSLAISGAYMHHMRWNWTPDMTMWRDDQHEYCGTPSLAVIPPPAIHTSQALDSGVNQLVDIFSPPRLDFSEKDGWVLNANDYPMP